MIKLLVYMHIFTDVSLNQQTGVAIGSFYFSNNLDVIDKSKIFSIRFESTYATVGECRTIQHAFKYIHLCYNNSLIIPEIYLYTDCQRFVNLVTGKNILWNSDLNFCLFFDLICTINKFNIKIIWTKGHMAINLRKEKYEMIFPFIYRSTYQKNFEANSQRGE